MSSYSSSSSSISKSFSSSFTKSSGFFVANGMSSTNNESCGSSSSSYMFEKKNPHTENGRQIGRSLCAWHYTKDDIMRITASRKDGISYQQELTLRQKCCRFLHEMVNNLTQSKGDHLATGVAAVIINRFYKFHSFKMFDYRDIAAACLFLAGKNEDSPRKLKYIVTCWWNLKFPHTKTFSSESQFLSACDLIVNLENIVLMTISFDMNIDLPHHLVLKIMSIAERTNKYRDITRTAYFMTTEILMVTDWSIRYPCAFIAAACINIAAYFQNVEMDRIVNPDMQNRWFQIEDPEMSSQDLREMTSEFLEIFRNPDIRYGSLRKLDVHNKIEIKISSPSEIPESPGQSTENLGECPAPPPAPILNPKKIAMDDYKERNRTNLSSSGGSSSNLAASSANSGRASFLPDMSKELAKNPQINDLFRVKKESPSSSSHNGDGDRNGHQHHHKEHRKEHKHHNSNHHSHRNHTNGHNHNHNSSSNNGIGHNEKRAQLGYSNEFEPQEKRIKTEQNAVFYKSSTTTTSSDSSSTTTKTVQMSAYAMAATSLKNGSSSLMRKTPIADKPQQSAYQQMVAEMEKNKSRRSVDPSPPTISPPFSSHPPFPPTFPPISNDEMEDGEVL